MLFAACGVAAWPLFGGVVINEIHYHPASEDVREEFIELHNTGDNPVDLDGWSLRRGVRFDFPKATVPARGYLVLAADGATMVNVHRGEGTVDESPIWWRPCADDHQHSTGKPRGLVTGSPQRIRRGT